MHPTKRVLVLLGIVALQPHPTHSADSSAPLGRPWMFAGLSRWERMDGKPATAESSVTSNKSTAGKSNNNKSRPPNLVQGLSTGRRACSLYIWDAPSALFHKWCSHLLKDCIYEGKGGRKFVRIEPGSILQLLYPCSRYSPDRCVICGGAFQDHLTLWWSKHLYSPLDLVLDRTRREGVTRSADLLVNNMQQKTPQKASTVPVAPVSHAKHVFHRRYVTDIETAEVVEVNTPQKRGHSDDHAASNLEQRTVREAQVSYSVPKLMTNSDGDGDVGFKPSVTLRMVRELLIQSVEGLIHLENKDNASLAKSPW